MGEPVYRMLLTGPGENNPGDTKVKLPKLSLPHFNGDLIKCPIFWDSYVSANHTNDKLMDVDKF